MDIWRVLAEEKINEAIRRGDFEDLPGSGKPLPPDEMDRVPEELRMSYKLLKNAGLLPEEMQLRKEMLSLQELLSACIDDNQKEVLTRQLSAKQMRYQAIMGDRGWPDSSTFSAYESSIHRKLTSAE